MEAAAAARASTRIVLSRSEKLLRTERCANIPVLYLIDASHGRLYQINITYAKIGRKSRGL